MSSIKTVVKVMLCRISFSCAVGLRVLRNDVRFGSEADISSLTISSIIRSQLDTLVLLPLPTWPWHQRLNMQC